MSDESSSRWNENVCTAFWEIRFTCFWSGDYPNKILMSEYLDNVFWYALLGDPSQASLRTIVVFPYYVVFRETLILCYSNVAFWWLRDCLLTFEVMSFWKPLFMLFWYLQKCQLAYSTRLDKNVTISLPWFTFNFFISDLAQLSNQPSRRSISTGCGAWQARSVWWFTSLQALTLLKVKWYSNCCLQ